MYVLCTNYKLQEVLLAKYHFLNVNYCAARVFSSNIAAFDFIQEIMCYFNQPLYLWLVGTLK